MSRGLSMSEVEEGVLRIGSGRLESRRTSSVEGEGVMAASGESSISIAASLTASFSSSQTSCFNRSTANHSSSRFLTFSSP